MGTALAVQDRKEIAIAADFSSEQVALLGRTIAKGCSEDEMKLFLQVAKIKRLDPFTGQIRPMKRWDSTMGRETMTVQTGIDGFRVIAARTRELAGSDDPVYNDDSVEIPMWAKVTVYRWSNGERTPYTATARWSEYVQRKKSGEVNSMWGRMPYLMLGKVAEALALRKAFPDELSGVYTFDEMGQAENPEPQATVTSIKPQVQQPRRASESKTNDPLADETISGSIQSAKSGGKGSMWLKVNDRLIVAETDKVNGEMAEGNYLSVRTVKQKSEKIGEYFKVLEVLECTSVEDVEPSEAVERDEPIENEDGSKTYFAADTKQATKPAETLQNLIASGAVTTATNAVAFDESAKPGTIGVNRARRLHAIVSQNEERTGFTHASLDRVVREMKLQHLRDLPLAAHEAVEKYADGTVPYDQED